ncbi:nuclear transcription factor Y subunit A-1-like isoform X2 [Olea europaea var. sylvestris]|uniref:nuclear transcription factor Y subunit A-1-like isoform X2 n=1 Tax=Olea europaea var. sylvestris TaxID=158386 RepID=UPI000C1CF0DD|nr:nuclear transcription factor Y subunit A-1-like isoform X2 [Olea europaea var. sylvestris]
MDTAFSYLEKLGSMQSNCKRVNPGESNLYNVSKPRVRSEPWGSDTGYKPSPAAMMQGNTSDSSSLEQSVDGQSQSEGGMNEEDDAAVKQTSSTLPLNPDRNHGDDDQNQFAPTVQPRIESLVQPPQLELVGHSIACASNPYDPYYGGMMAAYGQPLVPPHLFDMHPARMPLPLEMEQEPVYVNAKQYNGILRRRQMRAKAELEKKLIKVRKPYLHESRHQHALRRARGSGGRFTKKSDAATSNGADSGSTVSPQSINSSASKALPPESNEANVPAVQHAHNNDVRNFRNQTNKQEQAYQSTGEGHPSGQQWGNIPSNRAFAMK